MRYVVERIHLDLKKRLEFNYADKQCIYKPLQYPLW